MAGQECLPHRDFFAETSFFHGSAHLLFFVRATDEIRRVCVCTSSSAHITRPPRVDRAHEIGGGSPTRGFRRNDRQVGGNKEGRVSRSERAACPASASAASALLVQTKSPFVQCPTSVVSPQLFPSYHQQHDTSHPSLSLVTLPFLAGSRGVREHHDRQPTKTCP